VQIHHHPQVVKYVREHKVPLELCPTSNWLTNAVPSLGAHPFRKLMDEGVLVTLNSDNPGIFAIDLPNEYQVLVEHLGFKRAEFDRINDIAAAASLFRWPRNSNIGLGPFNKYVAY